MGRDDRSSILLAGADKVGITMIETRDQMMQLCRMSVHSEAETDTMVRPLFVQGDAAAGVVA